MCTKALLSIVASGGSTADDHLKGTKCTWLNYYRSVHRRSAEFTWPMSLDQITYFTNGVDSSLMVIRCWTSKSTTCKGIVQFCSQLITLD